MKRILLTLLLALFALPLFAGNESMPAFILFKLVDSPDPSDPMTYGKGCPIHVFDHSTYGGSQSLPIFGEIEITDETVGNIKTSYVVPWRKALDWEVINSDMPTDTHQIRAFVKPEYVSASGANGLTRDAVESFLNEWAATVDSIGAGEVNFTTNIYEAIKSNGFWERNVQMFAWTEVGYDAPTGIHRVRVNYTGYTINLAEYAAQIVNRGCEIVSNQPAQKRVTFDCSRDNVRDEFKQSVKQLFDGQYAINKWRLNQAGIDALIANDGRMTMTKAEAMEFLRNRLDD